MTAGTAAAIFRANIALSFIAGGLLWASAAIPGFAAPMNWAADFLSWPIDGHPGPLNPAGYFLSGIGGGVLTALGVLNWLLVAPALEAGDRRILNAALASVFSWFAIDSTGSVLSGNAANVFFNAVILSFYVGPILLARRPA